MSSIKQWSILCSGCIFKQCLLTWSVECCGMPALSCKSRWKRKPSSASIQSQQRALVVTGWYYGSEWTLAWFYCGHAWRLTLPLPSPGSVPGLPLWPLPLATAAHWPSIASTLPAQWVEQPSIRHTINATTPRLLQCWYRVHWVNSGSRLFSHRQKWQYFPLSTSKSLLYRNS